MRRRTLPRHKTDVELFPFLSILACTIGTLILLIIVLTTQAFEQPTETRKEENDSQEKKVKIVAKDEGKNGTNSSKTPRYIECREDGAILYPNKVFIPQAELASPSSSLQELITLIKLNRDTQYLIIAVRPGGIDVFKQVRSLAENAAIDIGYEPIDEDWQLVTGEEALNETQK